MAPPQLYKTWDEEAEGKEVVKQQSIAARRARCRGRRGGARGRRDGLTGRRASPGALMSKIRRHRGAARLEGRRPEEGGAVQGRVSGRGLGRRRGRAAAAIHFDVPADRREAPPPPPGA